MLKFLDEKLLSDVRPSEEAFSRDVLIFDYHLVPGELLLFKILIDTCVWLDLARDYRQHTILAALDALVRQRDVELILPRTVVEEFARNKAHVIDESTRSLSSTMKRVKEAVEKFGDPRQRGIVLRQLNDVDHRLPLLGETAIGAISQIEDLFTLTHIIEISDAVKLRAAQRGIDKRAPFHRQRNGIDDAILIEAYGDKVREKRQEAPASRL